MKHLRGFRKDEDGVSGAVTATLIIATLTIVFTGVYSIVVPVWVENSEAEHMRQVSNDFIVLKKNIDSQIQEGDKPITGSSSITLKAERTDNFFGVEGTTLLGDLTVDPYNERFNISNADSLDEVYGTGQGSIYFESKNQYYERQIYVYSNGAVARIQEDAEEKGVVLTAPEFGLMDEFGNRTLTFSTITLYGEQTTISGSKSVTVQTRTIDALIANYEGGVWETGVNVSIGITSTLGYIKVYETYFNDSLTDLGYVAGTDFILTKSGDSMMIEIKDVNNIVLWTGTIEIELK